MAVDLSKSALPVGAAVWYRYFPGGDCWGRGCGRFQGLGEASNTSLKEARTQHQCQVAPLLHSRGIAESNARSTADASIEVRNACA